MDLEKMTPEERNQSALNKGFVVSQEILKNCLVIGSNRIEKIHLMDIQYSSSFFLIATCLFNKTIGKQCFETEVEKLVAEYAKSLKERLIEMKAEQKTGKMRMVEIDTGLEPQAHGVVQ